VTDATIYLPRTKNCGRINRVSSRPPADKGGSSAWQGVASNDGYLAIASGLEDGQAGDRLPATIKDSATKFSVREGEAKTLDLKLSQLK
jgi:hypothetical protein